MEKVIKYRCSECGELFDTPEKALAHEIRHERIEKANEMLNEGENGYLFRAGDVEDLKNKIEDAIMSKRLKEMGKKSKEIVEKSGYAEMIEGWKNAIKYALHTK